MKPKTLERILKAVRSVPSMPSTGSRMLALLEQPEPSVDAIEDLLRHDPGLTANVLKLANSAYFGIPSRVGSLRQALILLGMRRLVQLVIATCVSAVMDRPVPGYDLPAGDLWRHSIAVGIAAEALVRDKRGIAAEDVFTAALLHDVGKIVLGRFVKEEIADIREILSGGVPLVLAENMVLSTDHAEVGARILHGWSFPPEVVGIVRWHHDPEAAAGPRHAIDVVHLADLLCRKDAVNPGGGLHPELSPAVMERLGISADQFDVVRGKVAAWADELADALSFN